MMPRAVAALQKFRAIIERLIQTAQDSVNLEEERISGVVKAAIEQTGYAAALNAEATDEAEARLANLEELVNAAVDFDRNEELTLRDFIDHAALVSDTDNLKSDSLVTLMTIHAAKGLEFPLVFVVGLEDGLLPHSRATRDARDLEEERRLCYVAITRAEQHLYVTHAMTRRVYGEEMAAEPSQFLNELPLDLLEDLTRGSSWLSFALKSQDNRDAARALRGEKQYEKKSYTGQTYDSVDAIADFFRKRGQNIDLPDNRPAYQKPAPPAPKIIRRDERPAPSTAAPAPPGSFLPGAHVKHPKYGRGLVLRREGSGDNVKLTVNFPGYGSKKLIEKYAGLEKA
jgi:DNA helicase-2/ATP-dependent DNA helicase PcrA